MFSFFGGGSAADDSADGQQKDNEQRDLDPAQRQRALADQLLLLVARIEGATSLTELREAAADLAAAANERPPWMPESMAAAFTVNHVASLRSVLVNDQYEEEYDVIASVLEILLAATQLRMGSSAWTDIAQGGGGNGAGGGANGGGGGGGARGGNNNGSSSASSAREQQRTAAQLRAHAVELTSVLVEDTPRFFSLLTRPPRQQQREHGGQREDSTDGFASPATQSKVPFWVQYNVLQLLVRVHAVDCVAFARHLLACGGISLLLEILTDNSNNGALRDECLALLSDVTLLPANHEIQTLLAFENCFDTLFAIIREEGGMISGSVVVRDCIGVMHNVLRQNQPAQRMFRDMETLKELAGLLNTDVFVGASPMKDAPRDAEAQAGAAVMPPAAAETYATVAQLISALVRSAVSNGEGAEVRDACVAARIPEALVRAALESLVVSSGGSFEQEETQLLGTLALVVQGNRAAVEATMSARVRLFGGAADVPWVLTRMALSDEPARASVAAAILASSISAGGDVVAARVLHGLEHPRSSGSPPMTSGYVLATLTMAAKAQTPTTWFVAGHILGSCILSSPAAAGAAARTPWGAAAATSSSSTSDAGGSAAAAATRTSSSSSSGGESFFLAYAARTRRILESRQSDIATNVACLFPILAWLRVCPQDTVPALVSDPSLTMFFADWAVSGRGGHHAPLMCAAIVALTALMCPAANAEREQLTQIVTQHITIARIGRLRDAVLETDEWTRSTRAPALASLPNVVVYDASVCALLTEVVDAALRPPQQQQPETQVAEEVAPPPQQAEVAPAAATAAATASVGEGQQPQQQEPPQQQEQLAERVDTHPFATAEATNPFAVAPSQDEVDVFATAPTSGDPYNEQQQEQQQEPEAAPYVAEEQFLHQSQYPPAPAPASATQQEQNSRATTPRTVVTPRATTSSATAAPPAAAPVTVMDPAILQRLEAAEQRAAQLELALQQAEADRDAWRDESQRAEATSADRVRGLEQTRDELTAQFNQAYQLVQTRDAAVQSAERRAALAEMALADMTRDRNELMLLVAEMESALDGQGGGGGDDDYDTDAAAIDAGAVAGGAVAGGGAAVFATALAPPPVARQDEVSGYDHRQEYEQEDYDDAGAGADIFAGGGGFEQDPFATQ